MSYHTDRLVELFVQSARGISPGGEPSALNALPQDGGHLDDASIERGIEALMQMLTSEDGLKMGLPPEATFVCVGMALEEKPLLQNGAIKCYEKAIELLDRISALRVQRGQQKADAGSWEKAVVLQQLGAVCLRQHLIEDAARYLEECSTESAKTDGHPREATLFCGAFTTQQSRLEFLVMIEKLCANVYKQLGDQARCHRHIQEVERLSKLQSADAVERAVARSDTNQKPAETGATKCMDAKSLWAATPVEERRLKEYGFIDEGATVSLLLDLNEHLGMGTAASDAVSSLQQFRVNCHKESVDVRLRLQREDGKVCQFQLLLEPLVNAIIPEDTVPKLKGRDGKRRLEVKLFKYAKNVTWSSNFVKSSKSSDKSKAKEGCKKEAQNETKTLGSQLNPLSMEELARLPRPSGSGSDNRPSTWQPGPVLLHKEEKPPVVQSETKPDAPESPQGSKTESCVLANGLTPPAPLPTWVALLDERQPPGGMVEIDVTLSDDAGDTVGMEDLELDGDASTGLRLGLRSAPGAPLVIATPLGADFSSMKARWRKKHRTLELRLPIS